MLLQFTIKNHQSFRNETTLDLVATKNTEHSYSLIQGNDFMVLPAIAIYGANGAGKSNFIESLFGVFHFIQFSIDYNNDTDGLKHPFVPFLFAGPPADDESIEAEIVFLLDDIEYRYGFSLAGDQIDTEYLDCIPKGKKSYVKIFSRERKGERVKIIVGQSSAVSDWERNILKLIGPVISESELVLTFLCRRKSDVENRYKKINDWFQSIQLPKNFTRPRGNLTLPMESKLRSLYEKENIAYKKHLAFIKKADPAIQGLKLIEMKGRDGRATLEVYAEHNCTDGEGTVDVPVTIESEGTRAAISLYPNLLTVLEKGGLMIVDELDRSLHPLLLLDVIRMFTNPEINTNGAQLICTLHNALIMDKKNLRRDEIWFVEKSSLGESELYSLADIIINEKKVRNDSDYCKQYILGTFGAVPKFLNI